MWWDNHQSAESERAKTEGSRPGTCDGVICHSEGDLFQCFKIKPVCTIDISARNTTDVILKDSSAPPIICLLDLYGGGCVDEDGDSVFEVSFDGREMTRRINRKEPNTFAACVANVQFERGPFKETSGLSDS